MTEVDEEFICWIIAGTHPVTAIHQHLSWEILCVTNIHRKSCFLYTDTGDSNILAFSMGKFSDEEKFHGESCFLHTIIMDSRGSVFFMEKVLSNDNFLVT